MYLSRLALRHSEHDGKGPISLNSIFRLGQEFYSCPSPLEGLAASGYHGYHGSSPELEHELESDSYLGPKRRNC
jgi:hypothetical protein